MFTENSEIQPVQIYDLPIGSKFQMGGRTVTREVDGLYDSARGHIYAPHQMFLGNTGRLLEVGDGPTLPVETLLQYKQRLRTLTMGQAHGASVNINAVRTALDALNINGPSMFWLGMWASRLDVEMTRHLPDGTVGMTGRLDRWDEQGLWVKTGGEWMWVLGARTAAHTALQVISFPEGTNLHQIGEPTEEDAAAIAALKREVDVKGREAKVNNGWCAEYEQAVGRAGIDLLSVVPDDVGTPAQGGACVFDIMTDERIDGLPPGAVLMRQDQPTHVYVKTEQEGRAVAFMATDERWKGGYVPPVGDHRIERGLTWVLRFIPTQWSPGARVSSVEALREAPVGAQIDHNTRRWIKRAPDNWTYDRRQQAVPGEPWTGDYSDWPVTTVDSAGFGSVSGVGEGTVWVSFGALAVPPVLGQPVLNYRQMVEAPVGATIRSAYDTFTRVNDGTQNGWRAAHGAVYSPHQFGDLSNLTWASLPGAPDTDPQLPVNQTWGDVEMPQVGEPVTHLAFAAAPIGAQVQHSEGVWWMREPNGWRGNNNHLIDADEVVLRGATWRDRSGFNVRVGEQIESVLQAQVAPVGTVIQARSGTRYIRDETGHWCATDGRVRLTDAMRWNNGTYRLLSIGSEGRHCRSRDGLVASLRIEEF